MGVDKTNPPRIVVYCDESCHDLNANHRFMAIGSLWLDRSHKQRLTSEFQKLRRSIGLNGEIKWNKTSQKRLEDYKRLVDLYFSHPEFNYRVIVVEQTKVRWETFHGKDRELAFYKFYYELLEKWLRPGSEYLILLDRKTNRGAGRYTTLRKYLENHLRGQAWISDLTVINSTETPLAQLCDLFTGAVAATYNGIRTGSAKESLSNYIAHCAGFPSLRTWTTLSKNKFNIFKIDLG